jgi:hypothetical protein
VETTSCSLSTDEWTQSALRLHRPEPDSGAAPRRVSHFGLVWVQSRYLASLRSNTLSTLLQTSAMTTVPEAQESAIMLISSASLPATNETVRRVDAADIDFRNTQSIDITPHLSAELANFHSRGM